MKNPNTRQPDSVSGSVGHEGVDKPMNDPMGTESSPLDTDKLTDSETSAADALTQSDDIDPDGLVDTSDGLTQGVTPMHRQNIDESRIDEVLVEDALADKDYPSIRDIAANDAVKHSHEDDL